MNRVLAVAVLIAILPGCSPRPNQRIIHILNWHYVTRDDFAADLQCQFAESITDEEISEMYAAFLDDVEQVQNEQVAILRGLIREHHIRGVFLEGVTDGNEDAFRIKVVELPEVDLPELQRRMQETEDSAERVLLLATIDDHRAMKLKLGAVGRLMDTGELPHVVALEDEKLMDAADSTKNGFRFDSAANQARENEMARRLVGGAHVVVVILGGAHDLADEIKALNPHAEYRRIEPEAWRRAVER